MPWGALWRRLVHRLDRETSGAMVVARHAASAAWLSAAFARKSAAGAAPSAIGGPVTGSKGPGGPERGERHRLRDGDAGLPWISRTYWAIVEAGWKLPGRGTISDPVVTQQDGQRVVQRAETQYRTLAQEHGMAWLELMPVTGVLGAHVPICIQFRPHTWFSGTGLVQS